MATPIDVKTNIAIRQRVRSDLAPPFVDPRGLVDELIEDTDPETIQRFRDERILSSARDDRRNAAQDEARARRRLEIGGSAAFIGFTPDTTATPSVVTLVGPSKKIPYPFLIKQILIHVTSAAAAGASVLTSWTLLVSTNEATDLVSLQQDTNIHQFSNEVFDGIQMSFLDTVGQEQHAIVLSPEVLVPNPGRFLKFVHQSIGLAGKLRATVIIGEAEPLARPAALFVAPVGRTNISINTAPTRQRGNTIKTPRAARITVTQGGRIISSRIVAWESLSGAIRRDYFNRQVGGAADPNIQWIP